MLPLTQPSVRLMAVDVWGFSWRNLWSALFIVYAFEMPARSCLSILAFVAAWISAQSSVPSRNRTSVGRDGLAFVGFAMSFVRAPHARVCFRFGVVKSSSCSKPLVGRPSPRLANEAAVVAAAAPFGPRCCSARTSCQVIRPYCDGWNRWL